jgi:hypothetical protein
MIILKPSTCHEQLGSKNIKMGVGVVKNPIENEKSSPFFSRMISRLKSCQRLSNVSTKQHLEIKYLSRLQQTI